ncbi:MAG: hypothetical protein QXL51_04440 [Candidatus Aenigmatarchaeota archaeon]
MKKQNLKQKSLTKADIEVLKAMNDFKDNGLVWYWNIEDYFDSRKDIDVMDIVDKLEELKYIKPAKVKNAANAEFYKMTKKGIDFLKNIK